MSVYRFLPLVPFQSSLEGLSTSFRFSGFLRGFYGARALAAPKIFGCLKRLCWACSLGVQFFKVCAVRCQKVRVSGL